VDPAKALTGRRLLGHTTVEHTPSSHRQTLEGAMRRVLATTEHAACTNEVDLVILLDGSLQVSESDFDKMRSKIGDVVNKMDISSGQVRLALMVYGNENCDSSAACKDQCLSNWKAKRPPTVILTTLTTVTRAPWRRMGLRARHRLECSVIRSPMGARGPLQAHTGPSHLMRMAQLRVRQQRSRVRRTSIQMAETQRMQ
jgi:hypothetical protein